MHQLRHHYFRGRLQRGFDLYSVIAVVSKGSGQLLKRLVVVMVSMSSGQCMDVIVVGASICICIG